MKTTTAEETAKNLDEIISSMPFKPTQFASDQGNEFSSTHPAIFDILVGKALKILINLTNSQKFNETKITEFII